MAFKIRDTDFSSLAGILGDGKLVTNPIELLTYEMDAANDRGLPDAVVFPGSEGDVTRTIRWAKERHLPLVARGAGTGLSGGAVAEHGGLVLSFSRLDRILEFDQAGRRMVIEPGMVNLNLDAYVRQSGLYFPPDPASGRTSTLGGNVAENAGGPHCFKYGVTTNYVTGMHIALADGELVRLGGKALDYPEYDFLGLLTGAEGTLGILTQVSLRLLRYPPAVKTMMAAFESVETAGNAVSTIIGRGLIPATMEFMDNKMIRIIEDYTQAGLPVEANAALIIEVDGYAQSLDAQMDEIVEILRSYEATDLRMANSPEERELIWYGRKSAAGAMARLSPAYYLLDGTVPRSCLARTLSEINEVCENLELRVAYVFHAGDGNLHPFILIEDPENAELVERVHQAGCQVMRICVEQSGSITGEHGVGIEKRDFMPLMYNQTDLDAMKDIKGVFDPENLMNPGKIFPEGSSQDERTEDRESSVVTQVSLSNDGSIEPRTTREAADAIRSCLGSGRGLHLRGGGVQSGLMHTTDCQLSTRGLREIVEYAPQDLYVTVGAGARLEEIQPRLQSDGMWLPMLSPWPEATLGGLLSTNFNAPLRMRYGGARDLLLAVQVVLPDGRICRFGRPVVKNVAGYDLPKLFVGAFGTLGLLSEVSLKLAPLPRARETLSVPMESLDLGLKLGQMCRGLCLAASGLLLCKGEIVDVASPYVLLYTAEGLPQDVSAELEQVRALLKGLDVVTTNMGQEVSASQVWADWIENASPIGRSADEPLMRAGVAPSDVGRLFREAPDLSGMNFMVDLANGCVHLRSQIGLDSVRQAALELGGYAIILAAPVGFPGLEDLWGYVPESLGLMRNLKLKWDPQGLFNPGAFLV
jgi:D-lactate dehydrogenase (cytochrome)